MPAPALTPPPPAPLRSMNPATFTTLAENFVDWWDGFPAELTAWAEYWDTYTPEAGATDWGDIGGTLSAQTDLQAALDAKADAASFVTLADQAAYDALDPPDADTYYFIPEA